MELLGDDQEFKIVKYDPNFNKEQFDRFRMACLQLFNEPENLKFLSYTNVPFDIDTISSLIKKAPEEKVEYHVAMSGENRIIGISILKSDIIDGFEIEGIVVEDDHRLKGMGKSLIANAIKIGKEKNFKAVDVSVFADNKPMLILLIKMDFKPVRIINHARYDGEDLIQLKRYF